MGKLLALNDAVIPRLVAAADAWQRELSTRLRALSSASTYRPVQNWPGCQ